MKDFFAPFLLILLISSSVSGSIINVPNGSSTIQAALKKANDNDTIFVENGIYHENIVWPDKTGIKLIGQGKETIIDGDSLNTVIKFRKPKTAKIDATTIIDGFTIRNGYSKDSAGGVYINTSSPLLKNLSIISNYSEQGAGIRVNAGSPIIEHCFIAKNKVFTKSYNTPRGGAIAFLGTECIIRSSIVTGNISTGSNAGMYIDAKSVSIIGNEIYNNHTIPQQSYEKTNWNSLEIYNSSGNTDIIGNNFSNANINFSFAAKNVNISKNTFTKYTHESFIITLSGTTATNKGFTIENNLFSDLDSVQSVILASETSTTVINAEIKGNTFMNIKNGYSAIDIGGTGSAIFNVAINGNYFGNLTSPAIDFSGTGDAIVKAHIENNFFTKISSRAITLGGTGAFQPTAIVYKNVFESCSTGIYLSGISTSIMRATIYNNTVTKCNIGVEKGSNVKDFYIVNTLFFENTTDLKGVAVGNVFNSSMGGGAFAGSNNNVNDTRPFNTYPTLSYELNSYSYCIDKGIKTFTAGGTSTIFEITDENIFGTAPDIGRYESGLVNTVPTPINLSNEPTTAGPLQDNDVQFLHAGWNLVGYYRNASSTITEAFSSIQPYLLSVKNTDGFFIAGYASHLNTLSSVKRGCGYFVNIKQDCILKW